jgi:hypothetical protein
MAIRIIATGDTQRYVGNPRLLEDEHQCRSLSRDGYLLTAYESDPKKFDAFLRERSDTRRESLLDEADIQIGDDYQLMFFCHSTMGMKKNLGVLLLSKSSLAKKGLQARGLYKVNMKYNVSKKITEYQ